MTSIGLRKNAASVVAPFSSRTFEASQRTRRTPGISLHRVGETPGRLWRLRGGQILVATMFPKSSTVTNCRFSPLKIASRIHTIAQVPRVMMVRIR
jgi:hypothetical protein